MHGARVNDALIENCLWRTKQIFGSQTLRKGCGVTVAGGYKKSAVKGTPSLAQTFRSPHYQHTPIRVVLESRTIRSILTAVHTLVYFRTNVDNGSTALVTVSENASCGWSYTKMDA
jgi:hypothetical protein